MRSVPIGTLLRQPRVKTISWSQPLLKDGNVSESAVDLRYSCLFGRGGGLSTPYLSSRFAVFCQVAGRKKNGNQARSNFWRSRAVFVACLASRGVWYTERLLALQVGSQ